MPKFKSCTARSSEAWLLLLHVTEEVSQCSCSQPNVRGPGDLFI